MNSLISVIIPVYNVEKYLGECLDSVINQTYKNLQIILVDDGSTDNSGKICDEYAAKDSRIVVFHQQNAGAGAAKNAGLSVATGEYLTFADSDDYVETDAYEYMIKKLISEDADVIQCAYTALFTDAKEQIRTNDTGTFSQVGYLKLFTKDWTCCLLWDKLYKRSLFDNIFFETGHIVDDEFFTYQGIMNAKKIIRDEKNIYFYRKRKSSVTARPEYSRRVVLDKLDYLQKRRTKVTKRYPELKSIFDKHFFNMLYWLSTDPGISEESAEIIKSLINENIKECKNCGVESEVYFNLWKLRFANTKKIIGRRKKTFSSVQLDRYFD